MRRERARGAQRRRDRAAARRGRRHRRGRRDRRGSRRAAAPPPCHDGHVSTTADRYRRFAREAAPRSRTYAAWAEAIADDEECLALIDTLSVADRQPVLVLSAARFSGLSTHGDIRAWLEGEWDAVAQIARQRATQTNDPRRTTPLLVALQGIHGPVALLEVGASAGLGLLVDRYSHVMIDAEGVEHRVDPVDGPSTLELRCTLGAGVPVPT
ncbi:MAG: hypothetical protein B7Y93_02980, partial [Micrococcales bacterium 32-70-13]